MLFTKLLLVLGSLTVLSLRGEAAGAVCGQRSSYYMHTIVHKRILLHMHMHTHVHVHIYTYIHTNAYTYTHACTHTCIYTYLHTLHTHAYINEAIFSETSSNTIAWCIMYPFVQTCGGVLAMVQMCVQLHKVLYLYK